MEAAEEHFASTLRLSQVLGFFVCFFFLFFFIFYFLLFIYLFILPEAMCTCDLHFTGSHGELLLLANILCYLQIFAAIFKYLQLLDPLVGPSRAPI